MYCSCFDSILDWNELPVARACVELMKNDRICLIIFIPVNIVGKYPLYLTFLFLCKLICIIALKSYRQRKRFKRFSSLVNVLFVTESAFSNKSFKQMIRSCSLPYTKKSPANVRRIQNGSRIVFGSRLTESLKRTDCKQWFIRESGIAWDT